jgi:hypothetical protein
MEDQDGMRAIGAAVADSHGELDSVDEIGAILEKATGPGREQAGVAEFIGQHSALLLPLIIAPNPSVNRRTAQISARAWAGPLLTLGPRTGPLSTLDVGDDG